MTYQSCLSACCDDCGLKVYSENGLPPEREIADTALAHAIRTSDVTAMQSFAGGPTGWLDRERVAKAMKRERRRVENTVMRETKQSYGVVGIFSFLLMAALSGLISKIVSMVIDWYFNRASQDAGFGHAVAQMRMEIHPSG